MSVEQYIWVWVPGQEAKKWRWKMAGKNNELDALMRHYGLNATQVARLLGCTPSTVRRWRCGIMEMPDRRLDALRIAVKERK